MFRSRDITVVASKLVSRDGLAKNEATGRFVAGARSGRPLRESRGRRAASAGAAGGRGERRDRVATGVRRVGRTAARAGRRAPGERVPRGKGDAHVRSAGPGDPRQDVRREQMGDGPGPRPRVRLALADRVPDGHRTFLPAGPTAGADPPPGRPVRGRAASPVRSRGRRFPNGGGLLLRRAPAARGRCSDVAQERARGPTRGLGRDSRRVVRPLAKNSSCALYSVS